LPDYRIIIETDGDYWHGRPGTKYEFEERQILKQKDDRIKDIICKKWNNIILRFWENDINNNFDWIEKMIKGIINGSTEEVNKNICEIEKNYTNNSGPNIRCYRAR
jgi:very-short-patch-repair endonuclease